MNRLLCAVALTVCAAGSIACCIPSAQQAPQQNAVQPVAFDAASQQSATEAPAPKQPEPPQQQPPNNPEPRPSQVAPAPPPKIDLAAEKEARKAKWRAKIDAEIAATNQANKERYDADVARLTKAHERAVEKFENDTELYKQSLAAFDVAKAEYDAARKLKGTRPAQAASAAVQEDFWRRFKSDSQKTWRQIIKDYPRTQAAKDAQALLNGESPPPPYRTLPASPVQPTPPRRPPPLKLPPPPELVPVVYPPSPEEIAEANAKAAADRAAAEARRKAEDEIDVDGLVLLRSSLKGTGGRFTGEITGTVINRRGRTLRYVQITFNLYDDSGAQVGTALANINDLEAGGRWNFRAVAFNDRWVSFRFTKLVGN